MVHLLAYWLFVRGSSSLPVNGIQGKYANGLVLGQYRCACCHEDHAFGEVPLIFPPVLQVSFPMFLTHFWRPEYGQERTSSETWQTFRGDDSSQAIARLDSSTVANCFPLPAEDFKWTIASMLGFRTTGCVSDSPVAKTDSLMAF